MNRKCNSIRNLRHNDYYSLALHLSLSVLEPKEKRKRIVLDLYSFYYLLKNKHIRSSREMEFFFFSTELFREVYHVVSYFPRYVNDYYLGHLF